MGDPLSSLYMGVLGGSGTGGLLQGLTVAPGTPGSMESAIAGNVIKNADMKKQDKQRWQIAHAALNPLQGGGAQLLGSLLES